MQDAFLKVWERWEYVRSLDDSTGYLYRTAMNCTANAFVGPPSRSATRSGRILPAITWTRSNRATWSFGRWRRSAPVNGWASC